MSNAAELSAAIGRVYMCVRVLFVDDDWGARWMGGGAFFRDGCFFSGWCVCGVVVGG